MKKEQKINVLGSEYKIIVKTPKELNEDIKDCPPGCNCYGLCDSNAKEIWVADTLKKGSKAYNHVLRHELTHAIFYESGLDSQCDFSMNEQLVDWLAIQFPKIDKIFSEANIK